MALPAMLNDIANMPEPQLAEWIEKVKTDPVLQLGVRMALKVMKIDVDDSPLAAALLNGDVTPEQGARLVKLAVQGGSEQDIRQRILDDPTVSGVFSASPL